MRLERGVVRYAWDDIFMGLATRYGSPGLGWVKEEHAAAMHSNTGRGVGFGKMQKESLSDMRTASTQNRNQRRQVSEAKRCGLS